MPRGRPSTSLSRLLPDQAQQILHDLIKDARITFAEVSRYLQIQRLEEQLRSLRGGGAGRGGRKVVRAAVASARRGRRRAITAEQAASRKLQGKYLSLVRQIPASRRTQYAKIAKDRGREAAIREMQDALKK
jgi:O6-methylguanine-DNA--protein-cysteine methyltransferase